MNFFSLTVFGSSNINEVIRAILNSFFLRKDSARTKKQKPQKVQYKHKAQKRAKRHRKLQKTAESTKKHQKATKHKNITKQKHKNANKQIKIKNALKKHLREKKSLIRLFAFLSLGRKKYKMEILIYNGNVDPTKLVKVLSAP